VTGSDSGRLPDPERVVARARESANDVSSDDATVNLVVSGPIDAEGVERGEDGYVGESAGAGGRLPAVDGVEGDVAVHYPEPNFTADGPWLVLAPLSGFVSTVATGVGRAVVALDYDANADPTLDGLDERASGLTDAVRLSHDDYPVESDDRGVFTTGMTTFALDSLSVDGNLTATFDVSTTPATRASEVEARFADLGGVETVEYESVVGVERAAPSTELREAVEAAHRRVRGDCEYEWLPDPGVFAEIPDAEKMALGTGAPGVAEFSREQYETCVDLLEAAVSNVGVSA
jgi:hypothetical protein